MDAKAYCCQPQPMNDSFQCPFCRTRDQTLFKCGEGNEDFVITHHSPCGPYAIEKKWLDDNIANCQPILQDYSKCQRIKLLLIEKGIASEHSWRPFLIVEGGVLKPTEGDWHPERIENVLGKWPETAYGKIERSFVSLIRSERSAFGFELKIDGNRSGVFLVDDARQIPYILDSMQQYGWIEITMRTSIGAQIRVSPKGWEHFDAINRREDPKNPAFVAMWFGGKEQEDRAKQTNLFDNTISPSCADLGWKAERVDSQEHNDSIMDRIVAMIREAPFVIADLSEKNDGVYYEAGFARGLGRTVIYLCREGAETHFDLSGVNHVRWSEPVDLKKKLTNRILGTMGRGPHKFD